MIASIESLSTLPDTAREEAIVGNGNEQRWNGPDNATLLLVHEDDLGNVYSGLNLEGDISILRRSRRLFV